MSRQRLLPHPSAAAPQLPPAELYAQAACAVEDPGLFDVTDPRSIAAARIICARCPVRVLCLDWAMENEPWGIWGGMTARERDLARGHALHASVEERAEAAWLRDRLKRGESVVDIAEEYGVARRSVERWKSLADGA